MKLKNVEIPVDRISVLCQHWNICKLSLFGSVLRDDFTPASDLGSRLDEESKLCKDVTFKYPFLPKTWGQSLPLLGRL